MCISFNPKWKLFRALFRFNSICAKSSDYAQKSFHLFLPLIHIPPTGYTVPQKPLFFALVGDYVWVKRRASKSSTILWWDLILELNNLLFYVVILFKCVFYKCLVFNAFGRFPSGQAFRYYSSFVPHCGVFAAILNATVVQCILLVVK